MAGKKFKFRVDSNRQVAIKEVVCRGVSVRGERNSYSVGLDKNFHISTKYTSEDNIFNEVFDSSKIKRGRGGKSIYYKLDSISYMATLILQYNKKGKVIEKYLIIYTPYAQCSLDEIYCNRVTGVIAEELKNQIILEIMNYISKSSVVAKK